MSWPFEVTQHTAHGFVTKSYACTFHTGLQCHTTMAYRMLFIARERCQVTSEGRQMSTFVHVSHKRRLSMTVYYTDTTRPRAPDLLPGSSRV